jgi:hypothetical protein
VRIDRLEMPDASDGLVDRQPGSRQDMRRRLDGLATATRPPPTARTAPTGLNPQRVRLPCEHVRDHRNADPRRSGRPERGLHLPKHPGPGVGFRPERASRRDIRGLEGCGPQSSELLRAGSWHVRHLP